MPEQLASKTSPTSLQKTNIHLICPDDETVSALKAELIYLKPWDWQAAETRKGRLENVKKIIADYQAMIALLRIHLKNTGPIWLPYLNK